MKQLIAAIGLTGLLGTSLALAHPHENDKTPYKKIVKDDIESVPQLTLSSVQKVSANTDTKNDRDFISKEMERHFKSHSEALKSKLEKAEKQHERAVKKYSKSFDLDANTLLEDPDVLREAAKDIESLLAESGIVSNMVDIFADIIEDIEVENNDSGMALNFDGKTIGRLQIESLGQDDIQLEAMGRNMTIEKKIIKENGKSKTRIVIEMDDSNDIDSDMKSRSEKSGF